MAAVKRLVLIAAVLLTGLLLPGIARAQGEKETTAIRIGTPDHAGLGDGIMVQAVLADSAGKPISKATIYFVSPTTFLGGSGDMVLAEAVTNKNGQAVAEFANDIAGALDIRAEFRGDDRYAPAQAQAKLNVDGDHQVYTEQVGVRIPGLNEPPSGPVVASISRPLPEVTPEIQALWPSFSGWPVALVLLVIWSFYLFVVILIFNIAAASPAKRGGYNLETGRFE